MTPARRLLAGAIVVVGLLGLVVALTSTFGARQRRKTFTIVEPITAVEVESAAGPVAVAAGDGREVTLRRTERYLLSAPDVRQSVIDGVLRVRAACPRPGASACEVRLRLDLPPSVDLRVRSGQGAVSVTGMSGALDVATTTGSISLTGVSGPVTARTSAGVINGVDLAPVFMDASSGAGGIRLSLAMPSARVDLGTGTGFIDVGLPPDRYRVETQAGAGRVDVGVAVDATSPYAVRAKTAAGAIRIHPR